MDGEAGGDGVKDFTATISETSERAETWQQIFGTDVVHLKSPFVAFEEIEGKSKVLVYDLDIETLTTDQRQRLVADLSTTFDLPESLVEEGLDTLGCPILAEDVTVTIKNPQKWLDLAGDETCF